jgi:hypothetical protein
MNNKWLYTVLCCSLLMLSKTLSAQTPTLLLFNADSSYRQSSSLIQLHAQGMVGSNVLDNLFIKKSFLGGHLDEDHLQRLYGKMSSQNRAGMMASGGIDLFNFSDTLFSNADWGLRAGFSTNYSGALNFNKDLYKTVYMGNNSFAGQTTELGPLVLNYQAWQKFGAGIFNKKNWSSATLSLVAGQQYQSLIANNAKMFTSASGDSLALSYTGDYLRSDTLRKGFANGSGLGLALDLNYNLPLADGKSIISFAVYDIGFISWNKNSQRFNYDTTTSWTGMEVSNVFKLEDDSLHFPNLHDTLNYTKTTKGFTVSLPTSIHVRYAKHFHEKHMYEVGVSIWVTQATVPALYIGASQFLHKNFMLSERISYGGYGKFGFGIDAQWMPRSSWYIRVGTSNVEGLLSSRTHGLSGHATIAKFFGRVTDNEVKPVD